MRRTERRRMKSGNLAAKSGPIYGEKKKKKKKKRKKTEEKENQVWLCLSE